MSMLHRISVEKKVTTTKVVNYYSLRKEIEVDQKTLDQYKSWCREKIGTNGWNYYGQYRKIPFEFRFKRPEDLVAFKLTFGV